MNETTSTNEETPEKSSLTRRIKIFYRYAKVKPSLIPTYYYLHSSQNRPEACIFRFHSLYCQATPALRVNLVQKLSNLLKEQMRLEKHSKTLN